MGRITVAYAELETELRHLAWNLMGTPWELGAIATVNLSFKPLLDLVESLARERFLIKEQNPDELDAEGRQPDEADEPELDEILGTKLRTMITGATAASRARNACVHASWDMKENPPQMIRRRYETRGARGVRVIEEPIVVEELTRVVVVLNESSHEVRELNRLLKKRAIEFAYTGDEDWNTLARAWIGPD